jgi:hypothetical protein
MGMLIQIMMGRVGALLHRVLHQPAVEIGAIAMNWIVKAVHRDPDNPDRPVPADDQMNRLG